MTDLPEWALPIRDEMAGEIDKWIGDMSTSPDMATAALAVALPLIVDRLANAVVTESLMCDCFAREACECACGAWDDDKRMSATDIAAAIRQEAIPHKP